MKVFVVSHLSPGPSGEALAGQLSRIRHEQGNTVPVLVIDERHNLREPSTDDRTVGSTEFSLDDFLHENGISGIVVNRIALLMDKVDSDWVMIDFGQHDLHICMDFIQKIARYNYLAPTLRNRNLVILVPAMYLGICSRAFNASFNNLPSNASESSRSARVGRLFRITRIEKVLISLPLLYGLLRRVRHLLRRLFRRASITA
ncbi:hypothetical protein ALQ33_02737 [Pseudomonas syringae pv. philadelphi]|uniref:Uncharacterized protein n=1 Tax=Pseudomonas syringae pv. philadelphi TaxID=251706 RepID=A0A3M3ZWL6_9PSED|nr:MULTISPECIES: hypothetical protein [Pseudomonas syringae group]RMO98204.1 hypothetical protein ALQ33_02737 [Pseudomonas syringae pv. philadelphi]SDX41017.1 hypothetical protein SAMN05444514_12057 [Pseudomonas syringae]SFM54667.1 hypothetical protein SAMN05444064_12057 [Pseudomonas syringae]